jgi:hypothetical protein
MTAAIEEALYMTFDYVIVGGGVRTHRFDFGQLAPDHLLPSDSWFGLVCSSVR